MFLKVQLLTKPEFVQMLCDFEKCCCSYIHTAMSEGSCKRHSKLMYYQKKNQKKNRYEEYKKLTSAVPEQQWAGNLVAAKRGEHKLQADSLTLVSFFQNHCLT